MLVVRLCSVYMFIQCTCIVIVMPLWMYYKVSTLLTFTWWCTLMCLPGSVCDAAEVIVNYLASHTMLAHNEQRQGEIIQVYNEVVQELPSSQRQVYDVSNTIPEQSCTFARQCWNHVYKILSLNILFFALQQPLVFYRFCLSWHFRPIYHWRLRPNDRWRFKPNDH